MSKYGFGFDLDSAAKIENFCTQTKPVVKDMALMFAGSLLAVLAQVNMVRPYRMRVPTRSRPTTSSANLSCACLGPCPACQCVCQLRSRRLRGPVGRRRGWGPPALFHAVLAGRGQGLSVMQWMPWMRPWCYLPPLCAWCGEAAAQQLCSLGVVTTHIDLRYTRPTHHADTEWGSHLTTKRLSSVSWMMLVSPWSSMSPTMASSISTHVRTPSVSPEDRMTKALSSMA